VSPARITFIRTLIDDWISDDPITIAATMLLPDRVRWNGGQDHLPAHLLDPTIAVRCWPAYLNPAYQVAEARRPAARILDRLPPGWRGPARSAGRARMPGPLT
jgi:hypothetical protein